MKLIEVSPISAKVQKDSLTYFSSKQVEVGDVVTIEVRKSKYDALVLNVNEVKNLKQDIKSASFGMKKILDVKGSSILYKEFFQACVETKDFFIGNLGGIVNFFLPIKFLEKYSEIAKPKKYQKINKIPEFSALQKPFSARLEFYKKYLNEMLVNKMSVQIVLPTVNASKKFYEELKKDFDNIFIFHNQEKKMLEKYNSLLAEKSPCIIITTPSCLFIPRHDIGVIILENESSSAYRTLKKPYFDIRTFALFLARNLKIDLIFADDLLSIETVAKIVDKKTLDFDMPFQNQIPNTIVDVSNKENLYQKSFLLSKNTIEILKSPGRSFLFTLRKGLATSVICHDCKHILKDGDVPLVLFENPKTGARTLKNNITNKTLEGLRCPNCGSWNFDNLGIGTDTVSTEIKKYFPKTKIFQIDKEVTKTDKSAKKIIEEFYQTENAILIGTELAIQYLKEPIENVAIISIDTLLHIPSYKIYEKMLHLTLNLNQLAKNNFIIQTRIVDNPVLETVTKKDLKSFYKAELTRRETFSYPPFGTIIKITHTSTSDLSRKVNEFIEENLAIYNPSIRRSKKGKLFQTNIVLKLSKDSWNEGDFTNKLHIDNNLSKILSSLTPDWQIRVNPENLF
jgi:primosomal protein N'